MRHSHDHVWHLRVKRECFFVDRPAGVSAVTDERSTSSSDYIYVPKQRQRSGPSSAPAAHMNPTALDTDWSCLHSLDQAETVSASVTIDASALCLNCSWDVCILYGSMLLYRGSLSKQQLLKLLYAQKNLWQSVLLFSQGYYKPE